MAAKEIKRTAGVRLVDIEFEVDSQDAQGINDILNAIIDGAGVSRTMLRTRHGIQNLLACQRGHSSPTWPTVAKVASVVGVQRMKIIITLPEQETSE